MHVAWSAECAHDDPVLVVPWSRHPDDPPGPSFVDLRENPYDLDLIPEAEQHPPLLATLRALNASRSPVFTAKCDAWPMAPDELTARQHDFDLTPAEATAGFTSYIDLVWRERSIFLSAAYQQQALLRLTRLLAPVDQTFAAVECIQRPAFLDLTIPHEGFSITLYVHALGASPTAAYQHWSQALEAVTTTLRSREFSPA